MPPTTAPRMLPKPPMARARKPFKVKLNPMLGSEKVIGAITDPAMAASSPAMMKAVLLMETGLMPRRLAASRSSAIPACPRPSHDFL